LSALYPHRRKGGKAVYLFGMLGGALIPLQGAANRGLGEYIASYFHAVLMSLTVSGVLFILIAFLAGLMGKEVLFWRIFRPRVWRWRYLIAGSPGAVYMFVFALAIHEIGPAPAVIATIAGQMVYGVWSDWPILRKNRRNKRIAVAGAVLTVVATGASALSNELRAPQTLLGLGLMLATGVLGAAILWQFGTLAAIREDSSTLAASIMSSLTGMLTAAALVVCFAQPKMIPFSAWPTAFTQWWMYAGPVTALGIIALNTLVTAKIGKRRNAIAGAAGNVSTGFLLGIPGASGASLLWWGLQSFGCIVAFLGVVLSKRERHAALPSAPAVSKAA
jgi:uncharacterized membrane protein YdcZ (DUF606 family)